METPIEILTAQVKTYLVGLKQREPDKYEVYQYFSSQCTQYGVTEEQFFKEVLGPAYKDIDFDELIDDPDPRNEKNTYVLLFGERIHSLKRLGQLLFDRTDQQENYFEDMSLIKSHTDTLHSGDLALEYARLYKSVSDPQLRILNVIYHLNPKLPYRIDNELYASFADLLDKAFRDETFYRQLFREFSSGRLKVWLLAAKTEKEQLLPDTDGYLGFLSLIYLNYPHYPFYIEDKVYHTPQEIAGAAASDLLFRKAFYESALDQTFFTWAFYRGKQGWRADFQAVLLELDHQQVKGDERVAAAVQQLVRIISPEIKAPMLKISRERLDYVGIAASARVIVPLKLQLTTAGYVRALIQLSGAPEGVRTDLQQAYFFDLSGLTEADFSLSVDPLVLTKDKLYEFNIQITTEYQSITVPVAVQTMFPARAYLTYLVKYGASGALLFALIRFWLMTFTTAHTWMPPELLTADSMLPTDYPGYIIVVLFLVAALIAGFRLIRKTEKI